MFDRYRIPMPAGSTDANPTNPSISIQEYMAFMAQAYGEVANTLAQLLMLVEQAKDRSATIMVNASNFGADIAIPQGNMKSMILSRPTASEIGTSFSSDLRVTLDTGPVFTIPQVGISIVPLAEQAKTFKITSAGTIPAGWAIYVDFTNRQYNPGENL